MKRIAARVVGGERGQGEDCTAGPRDPAGTKAPRSRRLFLQSQALFTIAALNIEPGLESNLFRQGRCVRAFVPLASIDSTM
jgi:hypothetical protein